jgi:hypothetical protein
MATPFLLIRYGPAPSDGGLGVESAFAGSAMTPLTEDLAQRLQVAEPEPLLQVAAAIWRAATADGWGHILLSVAEGLELDPATLGPAGLPAAEGRLEHRPRKCRPLLGVGRFPRPAEVEPGPDAPETLDLAIDYRLSAVGPGDVSLRPIVFDVCGAGAGGSAPGFGDPRRWGPAGGTPLI